MKENKTGYINRNYDSHAKYIPLETASQPLPNTMQRRIGSTTYRVSVYFSETSRETMNDKVLRLAKSEVARA